MSVAQMYAKQMCVDQKSFGKMSSGQIVFDQMTWKQNNNWSKLKNMVPTSIIKSKTGLYFEENIRFFVRKPNKEGQYSQKFFSL